MSDPILIAKLAGALAVFVLGIWIGLGMPGVRRSTQTRAWRPGDRLRATWINRVFFRLDRAPRRFDTDNLIVPSKKKSAGASPVKDVEEPREVVRLRRAGGD